MEPRWIQDTCRVRPQCRQLSLGVTAVRELGPFGVFTQAFDSPLVNRLNPAGVSHSVTERLDASFYVRYPSAALDQYVLTRQPGD